MDDDKTAINIQCLSSSINETQATIRGYDTKSEVLAILMTLIIGILNFGMISDYKSYKYVLLLVSLTTLIALISLFFIMLVLFPSRNPVEAIDLDGYKPSNTYFIFKKLKDKFSFQSVYEKLITTDWQKELLLESLKVSAIRDRKHFWYIKAIRMAAVSFIVIILLIIRVNFICTTK